MIEVVFNPTFDRGECIKMLKAYGPVKVRQVVEVVCLMQEAEPDFLAVLNAKPWVLEASDGDLPTGGHQTFSFDRVGLQRVRGEGLIQTNRNNLELLGVRLPDPKDLLRRRDFILDRTGQDGSGVVLAIIDSGMQRDAIEFGARFLSRNFDFYPNEGFQLHATAVCSVAAGSTFGIAPGVDIIDYRCFNASNSGTTTSIIDCVDQATADHIAGTQNTIINLSGGGGSASASNAYAATALAAANAGAIWCASSGNDGEDLASYNYWPAEDVNVVAVGGIDQLNRVHVESNYGPNVQIYGFYSQHQCLRSPGLYGVFRGTSFSAPQISGLAAILAQGRAKMTSKSAGDAFKAELLALTKTGILDRDGVPDSSIRLAIPSQPAVYTVSGFTLSERSTTEVELARQATGYPDNNGAASLSNSTAAFATKGETFTVTRDGVIRDIFFQTQNVEDTHDVMLCKMTNYRLLGTVTDIYRQPILKNAGAQQITLTTPFECTAGDIIFVGLVNRDDGDTGFPDFSNFPLTEAAWYDSMPERLNKDLIHAGSQHALYFQDANPANGIAPDSNARGIFSAAVGFYPKVPLPVVERTVDFVGVGAQDIETTALAMTVPEPADIQSGDLLVMAIMHRTGQNTLTVPSGWTVQGTQAIANGGGTGQVAAILTKTADGSETGSLAVSFTGTAGRLIGQMAAFRGPNLVFAVDAQGDFVTAGAGAYPAITGGNYPGTNDGFAMAVWTTSLANTDPAFAPSHIIDQMGQFNPAAFADSRLFWGYRWIGDAALGTALTGETTLANAADFGYICFSVQEGP